MHSTYLKAPLQRPLHAIARCTGFALAGFAYITPYNGCRFLLSSSSVSLPLPSHGPIDIKLWPKEATKSVRNFVQLYLEGYVDNTIFHRVIPRFLVQGSDPTGSGTSNFHALLIIS